MSRAQSRQYRSGVAGWRAFVGGLSGIVFLANAGGAHAAICNIEIYHSDRGKKEGEASRRFQPAEQFQVCFKILEDGYVTLWDRMPSTGPVERLAPNDNFRGEGERAVKVSAGETRCFGDGTEGYLLHMDPKDGVGNGLMWLVFTDSEAKQPIDGAYDTASDFQKGFSRIGAGSIPVDAPVGGERSADPDACEGSSTLRYLYRVSLP